MNKELQTCVRCVMDTTADEIEFDSSGVCNSCRYITKEIKPRLDRIKSDEGKVDSERIINEIKKSGKGRKYDSVLGISGGVDSSYLAYLAFTNGLNPLLVHVDTGWDTEETIRNLKLIASSLEFDLEIFNINWEEMKDLQISFYKASVKNCEIPQDHIFLAGLYKVAENHGIKYILLGTNFSTESILPRSWGHNAGDLRHLLSIHKKFGKIPLKNIPKLSLIKRYIYYPIIKGIKIVRLLNYVEYNRSEAKRILINRFNWYDYGYKHYESVLTRFFQGYYLPKKFGIDKRKAHFSSLINTGQMSREEALEELAKPPYQNEKQIEEDKTYIANKLGLSMSDWEEILSLPIREHDEFHNSDLLFKLKDKIFKIFKALK